MTRTSDAAVRGLMASKFRNGGQTCICPNLLLVQAAIAPKFLEAVAAAMGRLRIGPGSLEETDIGPLIDDRGLAKVERHVGDAIARGARLLAGGSRCSRKPGLADRFYEPTLLADVDASGRHLREETFGPVVPARVFASEEEAIHLANAPRMASQPTTTRVTQADFPAGRGARVRHHRRE